MKKINFDLKKVPKTLILPLLGRAKLSQKAYSLIHDQRAIELVNSLNYDFSYLSKQLGQAPLFWMARAYHFDQAIKTYLQTHPNATVVNLGAGLETAFYRIDNGRITWIDLDLPEVISLRKTLLLPTDRVYCISKSILDYSWMDEVKQFGNDVFFIGGGLFMYFNESQVKALFLEIAKQFPQAELIFDSISQKGIKYANQMLIRANIEEALMQWGFDDSQLLEEWSPKIKIVSEKTFFKQIKMKPNFPILIRMQMFIYDLFNKGNIIHLKFIG